MATVSYSTGTPITVKAAGGNYAITLSGLLAAAARQSAKIDLGVTRALRWACRVQVNMDVAPVNGTVLEIWWSSSPSEVAATDNTGGCSGADAAYTGSAGGLVAQTKYQLQFIGPMVLTADADTVVQVQEFVWSPTQRYGCLVIVNTTAQALEGDNDSHQVVLYPLPEAIA